MSKLKRFFAYYRPHKGLLILDLSCAVLVSMIDIAYPMLTQYVLRTSAMRSASRLRRYVGAWAN